MDYSKAVPADVFGANAKGITIAAPDLETLPAEVKDTIQGMVPLPSDGYVFRTMLVSIFSAWWQVPSGPEGIWVYGPTGSGKTSVVSEFFARIGTPLCTIPCGRNTKLEKYLVRPVVRSVDGGTQIDYEPGPLALAIQHGFPVLLDEGDRLDPKETSRLHALLDGNGIAVPELGATLYAAEGFRIVTTANSAGGGDDTGLYNAVLKQDLASTDRYIYLKVDYPDAETDAALLDINFGQELPDEIRAYLVKLTERVRGAFVGSESGANSAEALDVTISTRKLLQLAHYTALFAEPVRQKGNNPIKFALDMCCLPRAAPETKEAIYKMVDLIQGSTP